MVAGIPTTKQSKLGLKRVKQMTSYCVDWFYLGWITTPPQKLPALKTKEAIFVDFSKNDFINFKKRYIVKNLNFPSQFLWEMIKKEKLTKILPSLAIQGYNFRAVPGSTTCPLRISFWTIFCRQSRGIHFIPFTYKMDKSKSTWLFSPVRQQTFSSLSSWS